LICYFSEVEL